MVFAWVADVPGHPRWAADPLEIVQLTDGPVGVGSRYRSTAQATGKTITAELEVTRYDPPERFGFTAEDLTGRYEHTFTVSARDSGSHVERRVAASLSVLQALLFYVVLLPIKLPNTRRAMAMLKADVE